MNVQDRIKKAHISIMQHKKFCAYSGILACGKVTVGDDVPTAATDGWNVAYNPKFVEEHAKTDPELRFLVLHEATHKAYRHMTTWRSLHEQDARLANVAADYFVNLTLQDTDAGEGFIKMLKIGIPPTEKYRGWSVQQIFNDLKQQQQGEGAGGEGDDPENPDGEGGGFDEHDWSGNEANGDPAKEQQQADEIQRAIRQGEIMRKKLAGKGAGSEDGVFGDLMAPKIDWRKVLREFVTETCSGRDESSWRKPNRRYIGMDIYMPSMVGTTMTELVVLFDTSGSVFGGNEMTRFVTELAAIIEQVKPTKTHVLYVDTAVAGHQIFEDGQFAVQDVKVKGGGGTDLPVAYDYLTKSNIKPEAMVVLTDGYTPFGTAPAYPVLWAMTSDIQAPYGVTIAIKD
jgi:predicted metal-dependent peptidase